ncbi:MAG: hypothetical protein LN560_06500 [Rickettsia endosymbiont of Sceptobius lativentris]|nr:hypothetical protein [Rickettsia endosymbiont of Sceptobius lativentris]
MKDVKNHIASGFERNLININKIVDIIVSKSLSISIAKNLLKIIKTLTWILHEGGIYKNKMAISLISGHGYVNFHLNYV